MFPVYDAFYSLLIGSIAIRLGLITDEQLMEALEAQSGQVPKPLLGTVLVGLGHVSSDALSRLLREQEKAWTEALRPPATSGAGREDRRPSRFRRFPQAARPAAVRAARMS